MRHRIKRDVSHDVQATLVRQRGAFAAALAVWHLRHAGDDVDADVQHHRAWLHPVGRHNLGRADGHHQDVRRPSYLRQVHVKADVRVRLRARPAPRPHVRLRRPARAGPHARLWVPARPRLRHIGLIHDRPVNDGDSACAVLPEQPDRERRAHDVGVAQHDNRLPPDVHAAAAQQLQAAQRGAGDHPRCVPPHHQRPHVERVEAIHVLLRPQRIHRLVLVHVWRQRQLYEDGIRAGVLIGSFDGRHELLVRGAGRHVHHVCVKPHLPAALQLPVHVQAGVGTVAHQDDLQPGGSPQRLRDRRSVALQLAHPLSCHLPAVQDGRVPGWSGHRRRQEMR
mmetsp:Transcript_19160/g.48348  ORF Transcript_19160/g.48348 Transcript_19160/m.48348 type:complete len:337 (-) Transcript_19160:69-1079(-)